MMMKIFAAVAALVGVHKEAMIHLILTVAAASVVKDKRGVRRQRRIEAQNGLVMIALISTVGAASAGVLLLQVPPLVSIRLPAAPVRVATGLPFAIRMRNANNSA
jgi:hypothetical protein